MKVCPGCKQNKPLEDFANNFAKKDGRQSYCRVCKAKWDHLYYSNNRDAHYLRIKKLLTQNKTRLLEYLESHQCVDCGEKNPIVLEFDHITTDKKGNISYLLSTLKCSWKTLLAEIEKCEVRCANCHRIKTFKQFGWNKYAGV